MVFLDVLALILGLAGLVVAAISLAFGRRARAQAERAHAESLDAISRSAVATELANRAHSEASDAASRSAAAGQVADRAQAEAAEALARATAAALAPAADVADRVTRQQVEAGGVRWESEQVRPGRWLIRNTGSVLAAAALVTDATRPPKFVTADEVIPRDVPPGDHLQFRVISVRDSPPPRVRVTWAERGSSERRSYENTLIVS